MKLSFSFESIKNAANSAMKIADGAIKVVQVSNMLSRTDCIKNINARIAVVSESVDGLAELTVDTTTRVEALEATVASVNDSVSVSHHNTNLLTKATVKVSNTVDCLKQAANIHDERILALEAQLEALTNRVATAEGRISTNLALSIETAELLANLAK
jgi:chromosome segregation ATPase